MMPGRDEPAAVARELCRKWSLQTMPSDDVWPESLWQDLIAAGVTTWGLPVSSGGRGFTTAEILEGNLELASGPLTVVFVLSQFQAACQRLAACSNSLAQERWMPGLCRGDAFGTVGISHLTTSRQHQSRPAVEATPSPGGFLLNGVVPWVTGAQRADVIVTGGTLSDGQQILGAVPTASAGVIIDPPLRLLALTGSLTGPVRLENVFVSAEDVLAGPAVNVLKLVGSGAGGLTTSALAVGHAQSSLNLLQREAESRTFLLATTSPLADRIARLRAALLAAANNPAADNATLETIRTQATTLAIDASQALLTATKGAGFVTGHPAERLVREALFFLVWSCPPGVATQLLREFSGTV